MNEENIPKAQPVGDQTVPSVCIVIDKEIENFDSTTEQNRAMLIESYKFEEALHKALPGALYDRLLVRMLERTASSLKVSHWQLTT